MEVVPLYFGFGDGPVSPLRRPLQSLKRAVFPPASENKKRVQGNPTEGPTSWQGVPGDLAGDTGLVDPSGRRKPVFGRPSKRATLGLSLSVIGIPRRRLWRSATVRCSAIGFGTRGAGCEGRRADSPVSPHGRVVPDLVIKLQVSPEVSAGRKQDGSLESLARRVEVVNRVSFASEARVASVDADQPLEQVLLDVKRMVWEAL